MRIFAIRSDRNGEAGSSDTRIVIPGSSNTDHIMENTQLYDFELTDEEMEQIEALEKNEKHDWY